jgi:hypothetical protein
MIIPAALAGSDRPLMTQRLIETWLPWTMYLRR